VLDPDKTLTTAVEGKRRKALLPHGQAMERTGIEPVTSGLQKRSNTQIGTAEGEPIERERPAN
jgi:hypothetical protein